MSQLEIFTFDSYFFTLNSMESYIPNNQTLPLFSPPHSLKAVSNGVIRPSKKTNNLGGLALVSLVNKHDYSS